MADAIKWSDVPNYDNWGPDQYWETEQWKQWFFALQEHFGPETARYIWSYAWNKQTDFSSPLDARTFSSGFRKFISDNKLDAYGDGPLQNLFLKPAGSLLQGASDILTGVGSGISNIGKFAVPVVVGAVVIGLGYWAYKRFPKTGVKK